MGSAGTKADNSMGGVADLQLQPASAEAGVASSADDAADSVVAQPGEACAVGRSKSALLANIEAKQELSYYFAHKPRETGEPRAPPPVHKPLDWLEPEAGVPQHYETIRSYLFSDEGALVKVFVQLEGVGQLPKEAVEAEFGESSLQLTIRGYRKGSGTVLRLCVKRLVGVIVPAECKHRVLANKVVLTLAKRPSNADALALAQATGATEANAQPAANGLDPPAGDAAAGAAASVADPPAADAAAEAEAPVAGADATDKPCAPAATPKYAPWSKLSAA